MGVQNFIENLLSQVIDLMISLHKSLMHHDKAKFTQVSTFFHEHIFLPWEFLLIKKLEIEKTKTAFVISVLKVVY